MHKHTNAEEFKNLAFKTLLFPLVWRARYKTAKKLSVLESVIQTIEAERSRAVKFRADSFVCVHDSALFLLLMSYDLTVLLTDQLFELRQSRKNFYSRQLCLLIYEATEDLPAVFGRKLRDALKKISDDPRVIQELGQHTKSISDLAKKHHEELKEIRTFTAAHREHNPLSQLEVIRKVDASKIANIAKELDRAISGLIKWLTAIGALMGNVNVMLRNLRFEDRDSMLP